ncbi:MAG: LUD domain-containing protein [Haloplanus sp.]
MATAPVSTFEDALGAHGVSCTRTTPDGLADALADVVRDPAVGVALPFEGATYPEAVAVDPTPAELEAARTGVTPASFAVANYGSLALPSTADGAEPVSLYPELHVAVVAADDVVPDMPTAFDRFGETFRETAGSAIVATGPSATADMGELVLGAHGPEEVHVVILDE